MVGELGVGPVELGVVEVGLQHAVLQVVELLFPPALCALEAARRHPPASPGGERLEATKAGHITLREMPAT